MREGELYTDDSGDSFMHGGSRDGEIGRDFSPGPLLELAVLIVRGDLKVPKSVAVAVEGDVSLVGISSGT